MYLLPLGIFFAVRVWRRGWRWRALIPFGATMALAVVLPIAAALYVHGDHARMEDAKDIAALITTVWSAVVMVWLARMSFRPVPAGKILPTSTQVSDENPRPDEKRK